MNTNLDRTFLALSDPTRRGILERLGRGPATIGELAQPFGLNLNGKKHVGILEEVDLVVTAADQLGGQRGDVAGRGDGRSTATPAGHTVTLLRRRRVPRCDSRHRVRQGEDDPLEVPDIMRAPEAEVVDAIWTAVASLLPP